MQYWLCIKEVRVNPCLLSSNESRPHLPLYVYLNKGRKRAVLVRSDHEFDHGLLNTKLSLQSKAFSSTWGANDLQFSLKVGALPVSQMIYHRGGEPERAMHCCMAHKPWITAEFVIVCCSTSVVSKTFCSHFFGQ